MAIQKQIQRPHAAGFRARSRQAVAPIAAVRESVEQAVTVGLRGRPIQNLKDNTMPFNRVLQRVFKSIRPLGAAAVLPALVVLAGGAAWGQTAEDLDLTVGKSLVIDYPEDIVQISTSDPTIIDASPVTTREILVHGRGLGSATLVIWTQDDERMFYNVTVDLNIQPLRQILQETFPDEDIMVSTSGDTVSLNGMVSNLDISDRAAVLAAAFAQTVVNNLKLPVEPIQSQVLLRVKFAELDRTLAKQYGVNIFSLGAANTIGAVGTGQFPSGTIVSQGASSGNVPAGGTPKTASARMRFNVTDALNLFALRPDLNLAAMVRMLQQQSVLQVLAEPNLVTSNGQEANFLVGGEFPIPVLQGGGNGGAVTIQYREFGIRLRFTPQLTENDTIKLNLTQEVSSLDLANGVNISGFFIPALSTRRAETLVELASGQSFVVAGLLNNQEQQQLAKLPVIGDVPILGSLFKSRQTKQNRTELVMLVTPEITMPLDPNDPKPEIGYPNMFLEKLDPEEIKQMSNMDSNGILDYTP